MKQFAVHFREHVLPIIKRSVERGAFQVAMDEASYGDVFDAAHHEAIRLGALHLPDFVHVHLLDWLATSLTDAIIEADANVEAIRSDLAAKEAADPVGHYTWLAAGCRTDLRWMFAAICPEYRRHLIAEFRCG